MSPPAIYGGYRGSLENIFNDFAKHMTATFSNSLCYLGTTTNLLETDSARDIDILVVLKELSEGHISYIWRIINKLRLKYNFYLDVRMYSLELINDDSSISIINKYLLKIFLNDRVGINPFKDLLFQTHCLKSQCIKYIEEQERQININIPRAAANYIQVKSIAQNVIDSIRAFLLFNDTPCVDKEITCKIFLNNYNLFPETKHIYDTYLYPSNIVNVASFITDSIALVKHLKYKTREYVIDNSILLINTPSSIIPHPANDYLSYDHNMPLGLVSIATYLNNNGVATNILDSYANNYGVLGTIDSIFINKNIPRIIGLNTSSPNINIAHKISSYIKRINTDVIIVCGGPHASLAPEHTLSKGNIDYAIAGEGEISLLQFANCVFKDKFEGIKSIPGIRYMNKTRLQGTKLSETINLSTLPIPDYSLLPIGIYFNIKRRVYVNSTRGCAFSCIYCSVPKFCGKRVRELPTERFYEQFKQIVDKYKPDEIQIVDDNFSHKSGSIIKSFCSRLISEDLNTRWKCQVRADQIDEKLLGLMQCAGCFEIDFGIESGNTEIQKYIRKNLNLDKTAKVIKKASSLNIVTKAFFMLGFPDESYAQMTDSINYAISLKNIGMNDVAFFPVMPFPGTEIAEITNKTVYQGAVIDEMDVYEKSFSASKLRKYSAKPEISLNNLFDPNQLRMLVKYSYQRFQSGAKVTDLEKDIKEFIDLEERSIYSI